MASQGLLFSEPAIAETCVWCELSEGINPAEWANLCRYIGTLSKRNFERIQKQILPQPDITRNRPKNSTLSNIPLVSIGPSGIGGQYQTENFE
ncbi:MAG: hypothetical protein PVH77_09235 [Phycisphaerales bacterium]|jgi:hypothetical protein